MPDTHAPLPQLTAGAAPVEPGYGLERATRQIPSAIYSLLRNVGLLAEPATTGAAADHAESRLSSPPHATSLFPKIGERIASAMGAYPLPDETNAQFQDAVFGEPEQWFPTRGLVDIARGARPAPKDVNLPAGPVAENDPRWREFALDPRRGPK
jgi:hypothetical protein